MLRRIQRFVTDTYRQAQEEQAEHLARARHRFDWEPVAVLLTAAVALTWRHYHFMAPDFAQLLAAVLPPDRGEALTAWATRTENVELVRLIDWTAGQTIAFLLAPLVCCLILRRRPSDYALKFSDFTAGWRFYAPMYLLILPALFLASQTHSFQHSYPFYRLPSDGSGWSRLLIWELLYAWQFLALEFFFRGFLVHGMKRTSGFYAVFIMTVPYCMIHFGKPPLETVGSIAAGVAMGIMSLRTRSIWMGAALHIAVAWTMDFLALWMTGRI